MNNLGEPLFTNDGQCRLLLAQGATHFFVEKNCMKWGDPDELQQVWSTSEAGKTHACCAERWSKDNTPPTFEEAVTIAEPLLAGVNLPIPPKRAVHGSGDKLAGFSTFRRRP